MGDSKQLLPVKLIENNKYMLRGQKVVLSQHLAALCRVETRPLVPAVKRNSERFPADVMSQLSEKKFADLKSKIVISSRGGSRRSRPYAFTEQSVAMLTSAGQGTCHQQRPVQHLVYFILATGF
jgi:hypothetical protein